MKMAEAQSEHRMGIETKLVNSNVRDSLLGVLFAGSIGFSSILGGIWLVSIGKDIQGLAILIGTIATLVGIYLKGNQQPTKESRGKSEE